MGLFINQHVNHKEYTERKAQNGSYAYGNYGYGNNCNCGNYDFGTVLVSMLPSIFAMGFQALDNDDTTTTTTKPKSDAKSTDKANNPSSPAESEKDDGITAEIQQQIDTLKTEKESVLSAAGFGNVEALNSKIVSENGQLTTLERSVEGENSVESLQGQIEDCFDEQGNVKTGMESRVEELNNKIKAAQDTITNKIPDQKLVIGQLEATKTQVENIDQQIEVLEKKKADNENGYSVKKETEDINKFMSALKAFQTNPKDPYAAQALKQAYEDDAGNGHTSVEKAWSLIEPKVNAALAQK